MKYITILIVFLLFNCTAKKVVTKTEYLTKTDTLIVTRDREIIKAVIDTLVVESPCDSVTGVLKPFKSVLKTPRGNVTLESVEGRIEAKIDLDSVVSSKETVTKVSDSVSDKTDHSEIVKYKFSFGLILSLIISVILNLYFIYKKWFSFL